MANNNTIEVRCFGKIIGKLSIDIQAQKSYFQFHPQYLEENPFPNLFPSTGIFKQVSFTQVFIQYFNDTFRGLPPPIADSLPDLFGNLVFQTWLDKNQKSIQSISPLEQLAYVANRGMGALEYFPSKDMNRPTEIDLQEIIQILQAVLHNKRQTRASSLNEAALWTIFKIGTSAGGARPKILLSEHKVSGTIIPGDLEYSADYTHYIVKLAIDEIANYHRELVEYAYYLTATELGIEMMPSKLIEHKHFATQRFDRQHGQKQHVLTATGMTGWDFKDPNPSTYENLFDLALFLKVPHAHIEELFQRMVFNVIFCNIDDHLKNHAFIYDPTRDQWNLAPAYDLTFALNPLLPFKQVSRTLAINGKRFDIQMVDLLKLADMYTIKNPKGIIRDTIESISFFRQKATDLAIPTNIIERMMSQFVRFE